MPIDLTPKPVPPGLTIAEVLEQQYGHSIPRQQAMRPCSTAPQRDEVHTAVQRDVDPSTPFTLPSLTQYPGGKSGTGTVQRLINDIPPHHHYLEPFLGGGSIMRHKRPAQTNTGFEVDADIAAIWKGEAPKWVSFVHGDGLAHLERMAHQSALDGTFIFIDPPYLDATTLSKRAPYFHRFTYDDHVRLLLACTRIASLPGVNMMVCALPNTLTERHLKGWRTFQYPNVIRGRIQTEQVWMNYAKPEVLHDYRYIGSNYRERERIRRKQASKVRELMALPPVERFALLDHINQAIKRPC